MNRRPPHLMHSARVEARAGDQQHSPPVVEHQPDKEATIARTSLVVLLPTQRTTALFAAPFRVVHLSGGRLTDYEGSL